MARLSQLKVAMGTSIFFVAFIFAMFLSAIMFLLDFSLSYSVIGTILFILFQYLIGPFIIGASSRLHYLKPGENQWLESIVKNFNKRWNTTAQISYSTKQNT
jgi:ACR3 family arsenite efflux pump ArsB